MTEQDPTPYPIPDGAEALDVAHLYEAYNDARAAKIADPTEETGRAFAKAQADLSGAREQWRKIREWTTAVAIDEWERANPEAAAKVAADKAAATAEPDASGSTLTTQEG